MLRSGLAASTNGAESPPRCHVVCSSFHCSELPSIRQQRKLWVFARGTSPYTSHQNVSPDDLIQSASCIECKLVIFRHICWQTGPLPLKWVRGWASKCQGVGILEVCQERLDSDRSARTPRNISARRRGARCQRASALGRGQVLDLPGWPWLGHSLWPHLAEAESAQARVKPRPEASASSEAVRPGLARRDHRVGTPGTEAVAVTAWSGKCVQIFGTLSCDSL